MGGTTKRTLTEMTRLRAENERLRAARAELAYVVDYFHNGIRPTDLHEWWRRACAALRASEQKASTDG